MLKLQKHSVKTLNLSNANQKSEQEEKQK